MKRLLQEWDYASALSKLSIRKTPDPVEKPDHYNNGAIEAIDAIKASMEDQEFQGYLKGNILKYLWHYGYKGKPIEDLEKCEWYLKKLLKEFT